MLLNMSHYQYLCHILLPIYVRGSSWGVIDPMMRWDECKAITIQRVDAPELVINPLNLGK